MTNNTSHGLTTLSPKVPKTLKKRVKLVAAELDKTMTRVIIDALESYIKERMPNAG